MAKITKLENQIASIEESNKKIIEQINDDILRRRITDAALNKFNNQSLSKKEEDLILILEKNPDKYFLANFFLTLYKNRKNYKDNDLMDE